MRPESRVIASCDRHDLSVLGGCGGGDPGKIIGDILSDLQARVDQLMSEASTEVNALLLNAGTQVQTALDSAKSNLSELMDQGYHQVNMSVQNTLDQTQAMVDDLNSKVTAQLHDATRQAQQLLNSMPLTNKNPQVTSYTPVYASMATQTGDTVAVDVLGTLCMLSNST
jgi:hypothetical protein